MSSLSGQQYNSKNMTGLSDVYSTNIVCDTIDVADEITLEPGGILTLPPASVQDSYLSSNVAFRNQINSFTLANNFAGTSNFNGTTNQNVNSFHNAIQFYTSTGGNGTQSRITQNNFGIEIVNMSVSQAVILQSRTSGGTIVAGVQCQNGTTAYLQGNVGNRVTVSGSNTPTISIQAPLNSNNFSIANTAWVVSQGYALLAPPSGQTFTGLNNFPTQLTTDNSTLVSTTAFVKNQNYITASSLTPYALLAPPSGQTFTGLNNFPTQLTTDNSTLAATTAYVKNNLLDYGRLTLATGATLQSWFGINRFSSNSTNLPISLQNTDAPTHGGGMFIASSNGQFNPNVLQHDTVLLSTGTGSATGSLCLTTWSSTTVGIRIGSNLVVYNGSTHTFNGTNNNFNGSVSLGLVGSTISLGGICSFTNTTTPVITQSISLADNSTKIVTSAWVKGQNYITSSSLTPYALLNPTTTQTFAGTGDNVFSNIATFNVGLQSNNNITLLSIGGGGQTSNIQQNNSGLTIRNIANSNSINLETRTAGGANVVNLTCENGNNTSIRGALTMENEAISFKDVLGGASFTQLYQTGSNFVITPNHSSSQVTISTKTSGGVSVENLKCQNGNQLLIRGSITMLNDGIVFNDIGGGASSTSMYQTGTNCSITSNFNSGSVSLYTRTSGGVSIENLRCSNGIDTTIRGTLTMLNDKIDMNTNPIRFVDGLISSKISQSGNALIIENISNVSSVQLRSTTAGLVQRTGITVRNGNETIIQGGSTGIIRVLGNDATIECDNFKSNAPFECGYLQLGTPITAKTNYDIGYQWSIQGSSFNSWSGFTAYGNVYTLAWNGTGDRTLGVWLCDICIATNTTSAMDSGFVLNIANNFVINTRSAWSNALTSFGVNQAQIVRLSCVLNITNLTDTYYLNFKINGGSSRTDVPGASQMLFTRIA